MSGPLVRFLVAGIPLALPVEAVAAVTEPAPLSPIPGTPPAVAGAATLAGGVQLVFDLEPLLTPPRPAAAEEDPGHALVLLDGDAAGLALRVAAPPTCGPAGDRAEAPSGPAHGLCSHGDRSADGVLSGVLEPVRLAGALRAASRRRG